MFREYDYCCVCMSSPTGPGPRPEAPARGRRPSGGATCLRLLV